MSESYSGRRGFLRHSALAIGAVAAPMEAIGASLLPPYKRQEWQTFKNGGHYSALVNAIKAMKANTNAADPASWAYWVNIHLTRCTHGVPYFLGWHRGYLYHFEKRLRLVSGDSALVLPYWDYYANANLPSEFTDPGPGNPLYVSRVNTNVRPALSMDPFSGSLINFQTGASRAFEPSVETQPHNTLHNIVGGVMADMQSPIDPIFWLHHANVDRLWVAWVGAGGGRKMPLKSTSYWGGSYTYTNTLTMARTHTYDTRTNLAYYYQNETLPTTLPALAAGEGAMSLQATGSNRMPAPPAVGTFRLSNPRATSDSTFSSAGALQVPLGERSLSVQLPSSSDHSQAIARIARGNASAIRGSALKYKSVHVVLDEIAVTIEGGNGGYFYNVYLNVPAARSTSSATRTSLIGTLGPFQARAAAHHRGGPAKLRYVVTQLLADIPVVDIGMATVSFVRVNGERSPAGSVIEIGEVRIELSTDEDES
jgi:tyrosinase